MFSLDFTWKESGSPRTEKDFCPNLHLSGWTDARIFSDLDLEQKATLINAYPGTKRQYKHCTPAAT